MSKFGYHIIRGAMRCLGALPLGFHHACGNALGAFAGSVLRYRRDVVTINLSRSFPDLKYKEIRKIRRRFYRHLGRLAAEAVWFGACTNPKRLERARLVRLRNPEIINDLYQKSGSVMLLATHCGNWELLGGFNSYSPGTPLVFPERDVHVVYKKLSSDSWDRVMIRNRIAPISDPEYDGIVETAAVMRHVLKHRHEKKIYTFITDQHPYKGSAELEIGEFMHQRTTTMDGAAKLANKFGMAVCFLTFRPTEKGGWEMGFEPICDDASGMSPEDIMKKYYELLQKELEATPWNYLWSHKRWK